MEFGEFFEVMKDIFTKIKEYDFAFNSVFLKNRNEEIFTSMAAFHNYYI